MMTPEHFALHKDLQPQSERAPGKNGSNCWYKKLDGSLCCLNACIRDYPGNGVALCLLLFIADDLYIWSQVEVTLT